MKPSCLECSFEVSGQSSDDEATRRLRGVEAELKALKLIKAQADADGSELKKDLEAMECCAYSQLFKFLGG